jgi:hypothetical protein
LGSADSRAHIAAYNGTNFSNKTTVLTAFKETIVTANENPKQAAFFSSVKASEYSTYQ